MVADAENASGSVAHTTRMRAFLDRPRGRDAPPAVDGAAVAREELNR